jgi:hypothetical protein
MERLMSPLVIEELRLTNGRVRGLMTRLRPVGGRFLVNSQDFDDLRGELTLAAIWLRRASPGSMPEAELAKEISDYRSSLEKLQQMLPAIERYLITQKARLETERTHLGAAVAWAKASKSTL